MAEAVALASSIIAIIQLADRVIGVAKYYLGSTHDCPSDIRAILVEISSLKAILESLNFLLDGTCDAGPEARVIQHLAGEHGPIAGCRDSIAALERLLPSDIRSVRGKRQKMQSALENLAWPLRETSARKLMDNISRYKASIVFAVTCDSTKDIRDMQKELRRVKETLTRAERDEVCHWLEITNPSSNHNTAWKVHDEHTSRWMRRMPEWQDWLNGKKRFLWLHGIPGAGKTVLASFLVEECLATCRQRAPGAAPEKPVACIYYYCYFARNQDEAIPFLRWPTSQLCRQSGLIPSEIDQLFQLRHAPKLSQLLTAVHLLLEEFQAVFVILDAVDESLPRDDLIKILRDLSTDNRFDNIRLLATSREYYDIELCFSDISSPISIRNPAIEDDIRTYVHSTITSNRKFKNWSKSLAAEVENALAHGAKGMFRWVVCQIDVLQRLTSQRDVKSAISHLPKTLDETYERIFQLLSEQDIPVVRFALVLICGNNDLHPVPIEADTLLQAIIFRLERASGGNMGDSTFYSVDLLREACGCLISITSAKGAEHVSLAHYTVKEFLYSDRIVHGVVSRFALSDFMVRSTFLTTVYEVVIQRHEISTRSSLDCLHSFCILASSVTSYSDKIWHPVIQAREMMPLRRSVDEISNSMCHMRAVSRVLQDWQVKLADINSEQT